MVIVFATAANSEESRCPPSFEALSKAKSRQDGGYWCGIGLGVPAQTTVYQVDNSFVKIKYEIS
jgi:hypothetical protein